MSICIDVHLLSGKHASVEVETDASVESLKRRAQSALVVPSRGRLLNSSGEVLDGAQTVTEAKLTSGDVLTLHVNQVQLKAAQNRLFWAALSWWWRQQCGTGSAARCAADSSFSSGICCNPARWICGHLGQWPLWWRQQCGTGSAARRAADPGL